MRYIYIWKFMRNYIAKRECSVVCAYVYGRTFAELKKKSPIGPKEFHQTENKYARRHWI